MSSMWRPQVTHFLPKTLPVPLHLGSVCPAAGGREVVGGFLASAGPMLHFVPQVQVFCVCLAPQWRGGAVGGGVAASTYSCKTFANI